MNEKKMEARRAFPDFVFDGRWHNLIRLLPPDSRCSRTLNSFLLCFFFPVFVFFPQKNVSLTKSLTGIKLWETGLTVGLPPAAALLHISYQPPCFRVAHLKSWHQSFTGLNMYMYVYSFFSARFVFFSFSFIVQLRHSPRQRQFSMHRSSKATLSASCRAKTFSLRAGLLSYA